MWRFAHRRCDNSGMTMAGLEIFQATSADWRSVRDVRLRALEDAPDAFGSTHAREEGFSEADWTRRLSREDCVTFLARLGDRTAGIAGGQQERASVELVSMWVDPAARGNGVARTLVEAVVEWARNVGEERVRLWVTAGNDSAYRLYERCGFVATGQRQRLPSNPELTEIAMARPV
jgi:GNAT superfamily N-acetyltransferase